MGDTYYWSPSADNDPAPWLIHVFEQDLPDEARELLKGYIPLPDDVRFFVLPPWWLISNAAIYWLFILTPLSLGVGIMLKVVEIISVEGLQSGFGLVAASLVFFAMAYGVFRLAMPTHVDLAKRRRGEWRRGLFLGAEQMLYCTENNSGDRRVRVTWLHRSEVHTVRVRNRRSFGNLLLQPVAQLGCSRDGGESIHWFELLRPLAAVKPGPDLVMLWAEWAGLKGKLVPSEMRGDWDWESTAPSAE